jgi:hypothetical protein
MDEIAKENLLGYTEKCRSIRCIEEVFDMSSQYPV